MKFKRFLSILLVLCCLATLLPVGALPIQATTPENTVSTGSIPFQVNPLYADVFDASALGTELSAPPIKTYGEVAYVSESAGAAALRSAMVARDTYAEIHYKTTNPDVGQTLYDLVDAVFVHTGNPVEGDYLLYTYGGWRASYSYYPCGNEYYVSASFNLAYYTNASQEAAMDAAVDELLAQLDLSGNTDYQKIYAIYDYITANVRYDYDNLNNDDYLLMYTAYAALINKTAVCQGYANLFYRLALEVGVDARIISGYGGGPHAWNIVELDGKYYNMDATWDEGYSYFYWFLRCPDTFYNHTRSDRYETSAFHKEYPMAQVDYQYDPVASNIQIDTQPKNVKVAAGKVASATVKARGEGLTYQWYVKDKDDSAFVKSSIKASTYSVTMDASKNGRQLYCIIQDIDGNQLKTKTVTFTLESSFKITSQPTTAVAPEGAIATVKLTASGEGLTYKWYYKNKDASDFSLTTSFTGNTYSVAMDASRNGRQVYCVVTDKYGVSAKSSTATLYMGNPAKITSQPVNVSVLKGKTATVKVGASGDGLTYKWYFKNKGASAFSLTTSYIGNTYSIAMDPSRSGRQVYCVVSDKYGNSVKTNTVTLNMAAALKITSQPVNVTVSKGATATVKVGASGDGLTYKWYFKNKGASAFSLTTSFTGNTYSVAMDPSRSGRQVYCVISDKYGNSVKTNTVTLNMATALKITSQPVNVTVSKGATATVKVGASGDSLTYKWYFKNKGASAFSLTTSFTGNTYSVAMDPSRSGRQVYCVVSDKYGNSVKTNTVTLNMK